MTCAVRSCRNIYIDMYPKACGDWNVGETSKGVADTTLDSDTLLGEQGRITHSRFVRRAMIEAKGRAQIR